MPLTAHVQEVTLPAGSTRHRTPLDVGWATNVKSFKTLSLVRSEPTWVRPTIYQALTDHPYLSSSLILLKSPDWSNTIAIYPIGTLAADHNLVVEDGTIMSSLMRASGTAHEEAWVVCVKADGAEQRDIVKAAIEAARSVVPQAKDSSGESPSSRLWEGIGVCSWEALSCNDNRPTRDLLLSLLPSFPINTFLIDDGWQDVREPHERQRVLHGFTPYSGFGASMKQVVGELKARGVRHVGVWVTMQGYWNGIDPESELIQRYECERWPLAKRGHPRDVDEAEPEDYNLVCWLPRPRLAEAFWKDWFRYLKDEGVDFVKVDNQASYEALVGSGANESLKAMWSGMLRAVQSTWGSMDRVIMCMSHTPLMLNGPGGLDFDRPPGPLVYRNSDDFNLKYDERHTDFIQWNTYTSILTSHLALIPDFDMFSTAPQGRLPLYHALLRALGPGPTLISDSPGEASDTSLINRLTAVHRDGARKAVKMDRAVVLSHNRWFWDNVQGEGGGPALVASVPAPRAHGALIGAWNVRRAQKGADAVDEIGLEEVQDALGRQLVEEERFVIYDVALGEGSLERYQTVTLGSRESLSLRIPKAGAELLIVAQSWQVGESSISVLGMLDKLAPLAGVDVYYKSGTVTITGKFRSTVSILVQNRTPGLKETDKQGRRVEVGWRQVQEGWVGSIEFGPSDSGIEAVWTVDVSA